LKCRHCGAELDLVLIDLGSAPPSNAYLNAAQTAEPERRYPLRVLVCEACWLVQTEDFASAGELFHSTYAYFSGYSRTWLEHVERYVTQVVGRFGLSEHSRVVEVAANDGHLLQFVKARGIPCVGVEPTASTAAAARRRGIEIVEGFFGKRLGTELAATSQADLIVANNVLAHVPDINDFVTGFTALLKPTGVVTFEFAYVRNLIDGNQFDTIYHEHFSYLSMTAVDGVLRSNGLVVFDVEEIPTHGGSLRVYAQLARGGSHPLSKHVKALLDEEARSGLTTAAYYEGFQRKAVRVRDDFLAFLDAGVRDKRTFAAYGAAAKGNTLLNFARVGPSTIRFVVDANPAKQGRYLPGSHIPIEPEARLRVDKPDFVVVLPWNIKAEVMRQISYITEWGGRFVTAIPQLEVRP
jgi:SAM-dependent methyltransferase